MGFDFVGLMQSRGIQFSTRGRNVQRGHVVTHCPFCGSADPSQHMGIEISTGKWGCWRDAMHRGRRPERLIRAMLRCSWEEAVELAKTGEIPDTSDLRRRVDALFSPRERVEPSNVEPPDDFFRIDERRGERFMSYLLDRGFAATDIPTLCHHYGLKGCLTGTFRHRVIIPFFFRGDLVGWTARAIAAAENRYLSFPNSEAVKRILYNFDEASLGGDALVVVEGPIDALKIDFYAKQQRVRAIGLLGLSFTEAQISLLVEVAKRFTHTYILLDPGAEVQAMRLKAQLALISPKILDVGKGIEDPGAMTQEQVQLLAKKIHEILLPRG